MAPGFQSSESWHACAPAKAAAVPGVDQPRGAPAASPTPQRGVPRVTSLVFDIELEERSEGNRAGDDEGQIGVKELKRWLLPGSTGEFKLRNDVEVGLAHHRQLQRQQPPLSPASVALEENERLAAILTKLGYTVHIRTALGGGEGYECLRNLRHVFLAVLPPGAHATTNRFVVDLSFKEQFRIAKPTPRYQSLLNCLPDAYVAPEASVGPLVNFLCYEMAHAFSSTGVVVPPWRQTTSVMSKWLPRNSLDEQVPRLAGLGLPQGPVAALPQVLPADATVHGTGAQQQQQWHAGRAMGSEGPGKQLQAVADVVGGLTRHASSNMKPLACEPQRVVVGGNFSIVGVV